MNVRRFANFVTALAVTFLVVFIVSKAKADQTYLLAAFCEADAPGLADVMNAIRGNDSGLYVSVMTEEHSGCYDLLMMRAPNPLPAFKVRVESNLTKDNGEVMQFTRFVDLSGVELISWEPVGAGT